MLGGLAAGLGIGLAAGVSPGPLLVLVVTATLRGGWRHGVTTAAAPLVSDVVVVAVVLSTLGRLPTRALDWLGVVGGLAVVWMGVGTLREARTATLATDGGAPAGGTRRSLRDAAVVNLLSPHPWITWITILGPLTLAAARASVAGGVAVVVGFYLALVGSKCLLAVLVGRGRGRLTDVAYRRVLLVAGVALCLFGVAMGVDFGRHLL